MSQEQEDFLREYQALCFRYGFCIDAGGSLEDPHIRSLTELESMNPHIVDVVNQHFIELRDE